MPLPAGQLFGNYRLVRLIGEGGFGEVYLAENPHLERRAAVKVLRSEMARDKELVRRFLNEARAASAICHPNIIDVFDAGMTPEGAPYILMEFLEGMSLQKRLADSGRMLLPQALDIAGQAGSALAAAHEAGIVHRDLKPENLFLVPDRTLPGGERVKVLDFGIAKIKHHGGQGGTVRTQTGLIMGSPAYMSPEQCKDSADVDYRSDIYSFGTIVYEMLAGRTPFVGATGTELLVKHLTETPPPLRELTPSVPAPVEAAIARALARARDDRFENMTSFIAALSASAGGIAFIEGSKTAAHDPMAAPPYPASRQAQPRSIKPSTTFSRATGEVGGLQTDEELMRGLRPRRWSFFLVGATVVVGLAIFLLTRPDRAPVPSAIGEAPLQLVVPVVPAAPAHPAMQYVPAPAPPAAATLPERSDAGATPAAATREPNTAKRPHAAASDSEASPPTPTTKTRTKRSSDGQWVAH
jgi:serine/threonine protein kinase